MISTTPLSLSAQNAKDTLEAWEKADPKKTPQQHVDAAIKRAIGYTAAGFVIGSTGFVLAPSLALCSLSLGAASAIAAHNVYTEIVAPSTNK